VDLSALLRAVGGEGVAAATVHSGLDVVRVNTLSHCFLYHSWAPGRPSPKWRDRREPEPRAGGPLCQLNRQQPKRVSGVSYSSAGLVSRPRSGVVNRSVNVSTM